MNGKKTTTPTDPMATLRGCDKIAKELGLIRGPGTYNGGAYWKRPNQPAIITRSYLRELAGLGG